MITSRETRRREDRPAWRHTTQNRAERNIEKEARESEKRQRKREVGVIDGKTEKSRVRCK